MPILTRELLSKHRSPRGGYTKDQLDAIGVAWPPKAGWIKRVLENEITSEQLDRFSLIPAPDLLNIDQTTKPAVAGLTSGGCTQKP